MAKCSQILLATLSLQMLGIFIPYILVLQRNIFQPPLPFISQTTGFSPECGIFACLLIPSSFLEMQSAGEPAIIEFQFVHNRCIILAGAVVCFIIHTTCEFDETKQLKTVEQISFSFHYLYYFSWILICATPITLTDLPNKYQWVFTVLILHMMGALLMLFSIIVFNISQATLSWNVEILDKSIAYRKPLAIITGLSALIGIIALVEVGIEELGSNEGHSWRDTIYILPTELSFAYIITTVCEWSLIISNWLYMMTFYNQMEQTELRLLVRRKPRKDQMKKYKERAG